MLCVHLNRVIKKDDLNMIYIIGPGHGGPSLVAHAYLEGTYSESIRTLARTKKEWPGCSNSSASPAAFPATLHRKRPAQHS